MKFVYVIFALLIVLRLSTCAEPQHDCAAVARIASCHEMQCTAQLINGQFVEVAGNTLVKDIVCNRGAALTWTKKR